MLYKTRHVIHGISKHNLGPEGLAAIAMVVTQLHMQQAGDK